jgi:site-specific recombinase XerD
MKAEMVEEYMAKRLADRLKPCSVNREVSCLRTIFNVAISWGYASENPVKKVKLQCRLLPSKQRVGSSSLSRRALFSLLIFVVSSVLADAARFLSF